MDPLMKAKFKLRILEQQKAENEDDEQLDYVV